MKILPKNLFPPRIINPFDEYSIIEVFKICNKLESVCEEKSIPGLSAVQIGFPVDLFVVKNKKFDFFTNCTYQSIDQKKIISLEGCLSLLDTSSKIRRFEVERFEKVTIRGKKIDFDSSNLLQEINLDLIGEPSIGFQHEIDHSLGVCISDIGREIHIF